MMSSFMLVSRREGIVTEGILSADSVIRSANDQFGVLMQRNMDRLLLSRGTSSRLTVPSVFHLPPTGRMLGHMHEARIYHTENWYANIRKLIADARKEVA